MTKPETVEDVLILMRVTSPTLEAYADRIESALAASAEPVAWRWSYLGEDVFGEWRGLDSESDRTLFSEMKETGNPMQVAYGHAQPFAPQSVPTESLGRDVVPFPKQPAGKDPTPWFKSIKIERGDELLIKLEDVDPHWASQQIVGAVSDRFAPTPASVPDGWREDVSLAAQMLTWGRDEGLDSKQIDEIDAHAEKLFAMLATPPTNQEGPAQ